MKIDQDKRKFVISELSKIGLTYHDIGKALGISRQRVEQLINSKYVSLFRYVPRKVKGHNIITLLMRTQGLSVKKLSEAIGISPNTLYNKVYSFQDGSMFHRKRYFTVGQAETVAKFFGEKLDVLFEKVEIPAAKHGRPLGTQK